MTFFERNIKATYIAILFSFISTQIGYYISNYCDLGNNLNIKIYIGQVFVFEIVFLLTFLWIKNKKDDLRTLTVVMGCILILYFIFYYLNENKIYPFNSKEYYRHHISGVIYIALILTLTYLFFLWCKNNIKINAIYIYISVFVISFSLGFAPNVFRDSYNALYHIHAYINSIINAVNGGAYSMANTSIYGHYAILYVLPVKVLNILGINQLFAIEIVIAFLIAFCYVMVAVLANELIKNRLLVLLITIASMWPIMQVMGNGQYYQIIPHRILFPLLFILMVVKGKDDSWISILLGIFSMIWNLEIGAVCVLALSIYHVFNSIVDRYSIKTIIKEILIHMIYMLGCFFGMWIICSVYNILQGGTLLSLSETIFPMGGDMFDFEIFVKALPPIYGGYFLLIDLFLSVIGLGGTYCLKKKRCSLKYKVTFFISLIGLGMMTYYYNRPVYSNIVIGVIPLCMVLGILIDVLLEKSSENTLNIESKTNIILRYVMLLPLTAMIVAGIVCVVPDMINRKNTVWEISQFNDVRKEFVRIVPEEVVGFGQGVPELLSYCNRDTHIYLADWAGEDMTRYGLSVVDDFLVNAEEFVADVSLAQRYKQFDNYELFLFNIDGYSFGGQEALYQIGYYVLPQVIKKRAMCDRMQDTVERMEQRFGVTSNQAALIWKDMMEDCDSTGDIKKYDMIYKNDMDDEAFIVAVHNVLFGINPELIEVENKKDFLMSHERYELWLEYLDSDDYYQYIKNDYYEKK